ncbi:MAG: sensor histidine kinase [Propionivibrio sp.]|nr:sensor histidine kinase [Propionivibrio sp.]
MKEKMDAGGVVKFRVLRFGKRIYFDRPHFPRVFGTFLATHCVIPQGKPGSIRIMGGDAGDGWVDLYVIDDGKGIDDSLREQVFEPFFTTYSRGTGLGLYIARELCEANSARLELIDSGSGTDFQISGRTIE